MLIAITFTLGMIYGAFLGLLFKRNPKDNRPLIECEVTHETY